MGQNPGRWLGLRRDPYRAGEPARTWHLADLAPVGCRGFNGPVPQPSLDTCSSVVRGMLRAGRGERQGWGGIQAVSGRPHSRHMCHQVSVRQRGCAELATQCMDIQRRGPGEACPSSAERMPMHAIARGMRISLTSARVLDIWREPARRPRPVRRRTRGRSRGAGRARPPLTPPASARSRSSSSRCTGRGHRPICRGRRSPTACTRRTAWSCRPRRRR